MLKNLAPKQAAMAVFLIALATILGAWIFEYSGYAPCELCLMQRWAYFAAIPLALVLSITATSSPHFARIGLYVLGLIWVGSAIFGIYHSGIEWKWWAGPNTCTGTGALTGGLPDLSAPVVMCDQPAIRILGLSLAGWNAVISLVAAVIAIAGARSQGSSSVSQ